MSSRTRHAVILAAGMGSRLRPWTDDRPKPLVEVNGTAILHNALNHLEGLGVEEATIVVGHRKEAIRAAAGKRFGGLKIRYVESDVYATTGSAWSLWLARTALLSNDIFLLEGDVFFEPAVLGRLADHPAPNVAAVAPFDAAMQGSAVLLGPDGAVVDIRTGQAAADLVDGGPALFKTMNLYRLSRTLLADGLVPLLDRCAAANESGLYVEQVFQRLLATGNVELGTVRCGDLKWFEIDTAEDLRNAEAIFIARPAAVGSGGAGC